MRLTRYIKPVVVAALLLFSINAFAQSAVQTKNLKCFELRDLIQSEKEVNVRGFFGPTPVYDGSKRCGHERSLIRATWRTSDAFFCTAGFTCRVNPTDEPE